MHSNDATDNNERHVFGKYPNNEGASSEIETNMDNSERFKCT